MDGRAIRGYLQSTLPKLVEQVLEDTGLAVGDISRFIFHQADTRMLEHLPAARAFPRTVWC